MADVPVTVARIRLFRPAAVVVLVLAGALASPGRADLRNENLLVPLPPGFASGWRSPDGHMQEFVRPPETVDTWSRLITIQIFHGIRNADPEGFAGKAAAGWTSHCPGGSGQRVRDDTEHGYAVAVWIYVCPLNPATHRPETLGLKAIGGADSLYVAQYAARAAASQDVLTTAMQFLRQVSACDTRRPDRACPLAPK
jgi:hypothetical protein